MVDVCLVVEGSYPYVTGGVSAWAHDLLEGLPDVSFTVAHVGHEWAPEQAARYALPVNAQLVHVGLDPDTSIPPRGAEDVVPQARVYHAAATGAAGEIARRAAIRDGGGFALTEHGIAWREARWGIQACKPGWANGRAITGCKPGWANGRAITGCKPGWANGQAITGCKPGWANGHHDERPLTPRELEERADEVLAMALRAYAAADAVTSVCGPNVLAQRALGASGARVLPNAVAPAPARASDGPGLLVGFVGRVVAVKAVETFLRACAVISEHRADARFAVVGPTDHEPEYASACVDLAERLGIGDRVEFTGATDPAPWMARLDVLVLTSRSEAQPLVALEAMAAGVPVVATDVGGCREAIGGAGLLTLPESPGATAAAVLRIAGDETLRDRLAAEGRRRASTTHDPARVHRAYREMYERLAA